MLCSHPILSSRLLAVTMCVLYVLFSIAVLHSYGHRPAAARLARAAEAQQCALCSEASRRLASEGILPHDKSPLGQIWDEL